MSRYLFTSKRLGFRTWENSDIKWFYKLNAHKQVMKYFPNVLTKQESKAFILRLQKHQLQNGFCYFVTELLKTKEPIGFIGLAKQTYNTDFNPSVDIGWRLLPDFWEFGYATEGAKRCVEFGFYELQLDKIIAVAVSANKPSISVMKKIEMQYQKDFIHPLLLEFPKIKKCVLYSINK